MITGGIKKGLGGYLMPVGNIKIGKKSAEKKKSKGGKEWQPPVRLDHFIVTTTERGEDGNFLLDEAVMESIRKNDTLDGQAETKPKEIRVRFPFDDPALIFQTSYQKYNGKKLECEGNGEMAERKDKDGKITDGPCDTETCKHLADKTCKPSGRLACHLPDSPHYGGIYMYRTHGWNSVGGIMKALNEYHAQTGKILQGLPFRLVFTKKATEDHGNVPVVVLVMDSVELTEMRRLAKIEKQDRIEFNVKIEDIESAAVASGVLDDHDAPEEVAEEFYPEIEDGEELDSAGVSAEEVESKIVEKAAEEAEEKAKPQPETADGKKNLF